MKSNYINLGRSIIFLSLPIIIGQLGNILLGITDMIMLGQYNTNHLAAVGIANQIFFLITVTGMGFLSALTTLVANSKGSDNKKQCGEFLRSGIELSFLIGIGMFILILLISRYFYLFNQDTLITLIASDYLRILSASVFPMLLFLALKHFNEGLSYVRPAMLITFLGAALNIGLNWIFIYGKLSFPPMGAQGAAIATLAVRYFMAMLLVITIFYGKSIKLYLPPLVSTYNTFPTIRKMFTIGFPIGIQTFFESISYVFGAVLAGWISIYALAAHQIGIAIVAFSYMIASGLSVATSIKVANVYGKVELTKIRTIISLSISMLLFILCLLSVGIFYTQDILIQSFTDDKEIVSIARWIIILFVAYQFVNGLQFLIISTLRAFEDVRFSAVLSFGTYFLVGLPISLIAIFQMNLGLSGVWIGIFFSVFISLVLSAIRLFSFLKKNRVETTVSSVNYI